MVHLKLVTELDQVKQNLQQYNLELQNGQMTLKTSGVQQWFYVHELGLFGPSRYIGYADITIGKHRRASYLSGGETNQALSKWFKQCDDPELYDKISAKLIDYLAALNMDVRRDGKTRLPSFKLNLLKDEIPMLEEVSLKSVDIKQSEPLQLICQSCNKPFFEEPFLAHQNRGPFCSQKCLPEDVHKEEMADQYILYVENFRRFKNRFHDISNTDKQAEFLRQLEPLLISLEQHVHVDVQNDYVEFIQQLKDQFEILEQDALNYYVDSSHIQQQKAIHINWRAFGEDEFMEDELQELLSSIKEELSNNEIPVTILEGIPLTTDLTKCNTLYYENEFVSLKTDDTLDKVYTYVFDYLDEFYLSFDMEEYVQDTIVAQCPKCEDDQLLQEFKLDDNQILCCTNCQ